MRFGCAVSLLALVLFPSASASVSARQASAIEVSGTVRDIAGRPITGANIALGQVTTVSDGAGAWRLATPAGRCLLVVQGEGYQALRRDLDITPATGSIEVTLSPPLHLREDVSVHAVRAEERDPVTKTEIDRSHIEAVNRGQEMPFLLGATPSVTYQSDSGLAAGYAYFTIRGIGQTRLNITLDGIPLQDPEDQALYFSNFGDFASVVDSVQIQRGIGTSTVGSASYGGSVNFASVNPGDTPAVELQIGGGSWGSGRATAAFHSGRVAGGWALWGRVSEQTTDGFREHSGADQRTVYYGATRQDGQSLLKVFGFSGRAKTQLAFLATEEAVLTGNLRYNALSTDERDDFGQDVLQAQYTRMMGSRTTVMAQVYYNGAQGWFRIRDTGSTDLQQYGLNGQAVGAVFGATHQRESLDLNWGAHFNGFTRDHFMDIVGGSRAYLNTGRKREANTFLKAAWRAGRAQWWGDAQVRHARFGYTGDIDLGSVGWTFFNPRTGIRFDPLSSLGVYASVGRMSREPSRSDMLAGEDNANLPYDLHAVKPERVLDVEGGIEWRRAGATVRASVFAMEFRDEIALTGELSEIGLPVRRNVDRSYRRGIEVDADWKPSAAWRVAGHANLSRSRIASWTQFYEVYGADGAWIRSDRIVHHDVPPLLTPHAIAGVTVDWLPFRDFAAGTSGRWASAAQLDNTGHRDFRTPDFFTLEAQLSVGLSRWVGRGEPRLRVQLTNLLNNRRAWPGGYSYQYLSLDEQRNATLDGISYFYPLATRSVYVTLDVRF